MDQDGGGDLPEQGRIQTFARFRTAQQMAQPHGFIVPGAQGVEPGGGQGDGLGFRGGFVKLSACQLAGKALLGRLHGFAVTL
ncbi:MAG: hypothetical protein K2P49_10510, partial [Oscillospiraceae bacterium]|nr:hypothetical protein [Oscillospiraceae bacterium]